MKFKLKGIQKSLNDVIRTIGYQASYFQGEGEVSVVRHINRRDYPRFHLYITQEEDGLRCNLHLDQKKPSYQGSRGHSGEYEGSVVEEEVKRIQDLLQKTPSV